MLRACLKSIRSTFEINSKSSIDTQLAASPFRSFSTFFKRKMSESTNDNNNKHNNNNSSISAVAAGTNKSSAANKLDHGDIDDEKEEEDAKQVHGNHNDNNPTPLSTTHTSDVHAELRESAAASNRIDTSCLADLIRMLGFGMRLTDDDDRDMQALRKLSSLDLAGVAKHMASCTNIVFMTGAGISTSAGIPDFRSPKTGLYENLEKYNLPHPEAIFSLDYFKENPEPFFLLSKELMPTDYSPTVCHYFQRLLVEKNMVQRIYTQNIDALESVASIDADKVVNAHGSFKTGHCLKCNAEYSLDWMKTQIHTRSFLECEAASCAGTVKPDIVFFGEEMPSEFFNYHQDFSRCDLLIVMGTSLKVQPFGSISDAVPEDCPRLLINRDLVADWAYFSTRPESNYRDVALQGDCDDGCLQLAELLGWKEQLVDLIEADKKRLLLEKKRAANKD